MKIKEFNYDLVNYVVPNYKLIYDVKVAVISDIHGYVKSKEKSSFLADSIKKLNPHHIIIAGDNLQGNEWENERTVSLFGYFLSNLSENAMVFISLGNHDLIGNNCRNSSNRIRNFYNLSHFRDGMIFPLYKDKFSFENFEILSYTPSFYLMHDFSIQNSGIAHDKFIEEYNQFGISINYNSDKIIEFVGHNPHLIVNYLDNYGFGKLQNVDSFFTGHMHNGYISYRRIRKNPEKYLDYGYTEMPIKKNINGIVQFNPFFLHKIDLCRGVVFLSQQGEKKLLETRNGHFYSNNDNNKMSWSMIDSYKAQNMIIKDKLKALVISGGIKKFSSVSSFIGDVPEINIVTYKGLKKKLLVK